MRASEILFVHKGKTIMILFNATMLTEKYATQGGGLDMRCFVASATCCTTKMVFSSNNMYQYAFMC